MEGVGGWLGETRECFPEHMVVLLSDGARRAKVWGAGVCLYVWGVCAVCV